MRLRKGFTMRKIGTDHVIVPEGVETINFNKLMSLNGSASYLWESLQGKEFQEEDMAKLLTDRYEVAEDTAMIDAKKLADHWKQTGLIDE